MSDNDFEGNQSNNNADGGDRDNDRNRGGRGGGGGETEAERFARETREAKAHARDHPTFHNINHPQILASLNLSYLNCMLDAIPMQNDHYIAQVLSSYDRSNLRFTWDQENMKFNAVPTISRRKLKST